MCFEYMSQKLLFDISLSDNRFDIWNIFTSFVFLLHSMTTHQF